MLSKLRLAFSSNPNGSSSSSSSSSLNTDNNHTTTTSSSSSLSTKRAGSTTIPPPSSSHSSHLAITTTTILASPPPILDSGPSGSTSRDRQTSASTLGSTSTSTTSSINLTTTTPSSTVSSSSSSSSPQLNHITLPSSSPGGGSNYIPQATPRSANFPSTPFSTPSNATITAASPSNTATPATPPRAITSSMSGRYAHHQQAQQHAFPHSMSSSLNNSPATAMTTMMSTEHSLMKENIIPTSLNHQNIIRKKTKSTATLPSWIISSFSSSSSSSSASPKESNKRDNVNKVHSHALELQQQQQPQKNNNNGNRGYLLPSKMHSSAEPAKINSNIAFPLRVETGISSNNNQNRRGSLPISGLTPVDPASARPRSPSMLSYNYYHDDQSTLSSSSLVPSSLSAGLYYPPPAISPALSQHPPLHHQTRPHQQQAHHMQKTSTSLPSSPSTPIRLDKPPLKAPSPLSTASSPYQIIDYESASSPVHSASVSSLHNQVESPASNKPGRRKSILGKRRHFTEVWNNSSINPNNIMGNGNNSSNKHDELRSSISGSGSGSKKKVSNSKGHKTKNSTSSNSTTTTKLSGDYSSLLAASRKVFSKSVDDLTSFTRQSLLSSPTTNTTINYSRPRKSVDERRQSICPRQYGFADMQNSSQGMMHHHGRGVDGAGGDHGDVEEELDGLSSGSSASLAHSPMPSDDSAHSVPVYAVSQGSSKAVKSNLAQGHHHHVFRVPKLPSVIPSSSSSKHGLASKKETKSQQQQLQHRKAASSSTAQIQLPPSISLPGGLCIESTASILASSEEQSQHFPETPKRSPSASAAMSNKGNMSNSNAKKKRKSIDARSVRSDSGVLLFSSSPGLAPPFVLSPATSARSAPSPTLPNTLDSPSTSPSTSTSSFPKRPPLATKKSSGSASLNSIKSSSTARMPSFGSPKASSPLALANPPTSATNASANVKQRSSQIILIEGLLQRKTDHRSNIKTSSWSFPFSTSSGSMFSSSSSPSHTNKGQETSTSCAKQRPSPGRTNSEPNMREVDLSKGWKPFYAILRGTNLYLYKLSSDLSWQSKTCFSSYSASRSAPSSTSLSSSSSRMPSAFIPSTPLQQACDLDEDRIKASISNHSKAAYLLPIANSTIRVIHSATRGDVFELFTEEGEVAILQTSSKAEADKWIQVLSSTGLTIANKRASYLEHIGKLESPIQALQHSHKSDTIPERNSESHERALKSGSSQGTTGGKVFGVLLEEIIQREGGKIPKIAEMLFNEIENKGLLEVNPRPHCREP